MPNRPSISAFFITKTHIGGILSDWGCIEVAAIGLSTYARVSLPNVPLYSLLSDKRGAQDSNLQPR